MGELLWTFAFFWVSNQINIRYSIWWINEWKCDLYTYPFVQSKCNAVGDSCQNYYLLFAWLIDWPPSILTPLSALLSAFLPISNSSPFLLHLPAISPFPQRPFFLIFLLLSLILDSHFLKFSLQTHSGDLWKQRDPASKRRFLIIFVLLFFVKNNRACSSQL